MKSSKESLPSKEKPEVRVFQPGRDILGYISIHTLLFSVIP